MQLGKTAEFKIMWACVGGKVLASTNHVRTTEDQESALEIMQPAFLAGEVEVSTSRPKRKRGKKPLYIHINLDQYRCKSCFSASVALTTESSPDKRARPLSASTPSNLAKLL